MDLGSVVRHGFVAPTQFPAMVTQLSKNKPKIELGLMKLLRYCCCHCDHCKARQKRAFPFTEQGKN
ncbi:hypothetical protein D082_09820 [Synechocystis sp. PCC 6714]|nr:hypothetical protein D082_09820 [Synechocystis sp. PCC 6714]